MKSFRYAAARSTREASALHAGRPGAHFLAGGTTLLDLMKANVEAPDTLIDISALPLDRIETLPGGGVRIGALVRNSDLARAPLIASRYPALAEAVLSGASPQIRNMATVGGNLLQRTRCAYFRDLASPCNKRALGSGCSAREGLNRHHAILGAGERCIATYPGDMAVALVAFDAVVRTFVHGGAGRALALEGFHLPERDDPSRETVLDPGELILGVDLPAAPWFARSRYVKVRDRENFDFALASAAVALDIDTQGTAGPRIRDARIGLGGIATRPWRAHAAERALIGAAPTAACFLAAADAALDGACPARDNAFKIELAKRTVVAALHAVAGTPA